MSFVFLTITLKMVSSILYGTSFRPRLRRGIHFPYESPFSCLREGISKNPLVLPYIHRLFDLSNLRSHLIIYILSKSEVKVLLWRIVCTLHAVFALFWKAQWRWTRGATTTYVHHSCLLVNTYRYLSVVINIYSVINTSTYAMLCPSIFSLKCMILSISFFFGPLRHIYWRLVKSNSYSFQFSHLFLSHFYSSYFVFLLSFSSHSCGWDSHFILLVSLFKTWGEKFSATLLLMSISITKEYFDIFVVIFREGGGKIK